MVRYRCNAIAWIQFGVCLLSTALWNFYCTAETFSGFQTLTNTKIFVLNILARDHLIASGHIKYEKIQAEQNVASTKVLPTSSAENTTLTDLKAIRAQYGAASKEYRDTYVYIIHKVSLLYDT